MAQAVSANRLELLQIADAVAREKSIDKAIVIEALEDAIQKAARSRYGAENEIRARIDPKTGEIQLNRLQEVVETVENDATEISLEDARVRNPAAVVGDFLTEPLPPIDFGRIAAQTAKQVIVQKVRDAERDRQYDEFKDRESKRAGNPVLPLMNAWFGSPWYFPENFLDTTWTSGLSWNLPWRWVFETPAFHDGGRVGAAGVLAVAGDGPDAPVTPASKSSIVERGSSMPISR